MQMVVVRIRKVRDINDTVENFPRSLALLTGSKIKSRIYFHIHGSFHRAQAIDIVLYTR